MRKTPAETPGDDTPPSAETPIADSTAAEEATPVFNPDHEWPSSGGCYVRQADGTLKRED